MRFSNMFSQLFGKMAHIQFPKSIQTFINISYTKIFKIDLSEFQSAHTYSTLNALFTRELRKPRILQNTDFNLISPTDSLIVETGKIYNNTALQIKGKSYNVLEFLGDLNVNLDGYSFLNLYLSPSDYHHYHAPCDLEVLETRYFSGALLPVNKPSLYKKDNLYIVNERVVLKVRLSYNQSIAYYVAVGALNVGKMKFLFDSNIQTNAHCGNFSRQYETPILIRSGEEIGCFEMGSTVVLIALANLVVKTEDIVKMGQEIGTLPPNQIE